MSARVSNGGRPREGRWGALGGLLGLAAPLLLVACGGASTGAARAPATPGQAVIEVPTVVVTPYSPGELAAELERATSLLLAGDARGAADAFDKLLHVAPESDIAPPALFNSGIAHQDLGEHEFALERYREVLRRFPDSKIAHGALVRLSRTLAYLERYGELAPVANDLLVRADLTPLERIEALGAKALALVEQGQLDEASREVARARDLIEDNHFGEAGAPPVELAEVSFALGEVRRKRSELITFDPVPADFVTALEQRCQGLLDAQAAYTEAMRSLDAHWSAMAGFRVGQLYQALHRDVMQIAPPRSADTPERRQLFEGAMRLRYRVLLEKGVKMMDATVRLGERTGESSAWIARARDSKRDLEIALADEKVALAKLPYSEAELTAGLESLKKH